MIPRRFLWVEGFLFLFAALCIGRLFYWQVLQYDRFAEAAKNQTESTVNIGASRGKILASDNSILVSNQKAYLLFAVLPEIKKQIKENETYDDLIERIGNSLTPILTAERLQYREKPTEADKEDLKKQIYAEITQQLKQPNLIWVPLSKKLGQEAKEKIEKLKIKGIGFQEDSKRFYPEGSIGANLLGFVAKDSQGNDKGYVGLEGFYDDKLAGRSGQLVQEIDALGRPILISPSQGLGALDGANLLTTIDRTVQFTLEKKIKAGVERYGAKAGAALVIDTKTSGVLASVSVPSFNLLDPLGNDQNYKNLGVSEIYEPGSIFKIVTVASGLDSGAINAKTICPCKGPIRISGYEIQTSDNKYHPKSTLTNILQHSDNIGAAFISEKIGKDNFINYIKKFGFGELTGVDLQGEEAGIIKESQNWSKVDLLTSGFGQGLSVTALQMVNALAAIANDGKLMRPYLVKEIRSANSTVEFGPKEVRQVVSKETANLLKQLLFAAVEGGEARNLIPHGYRVGGKTGTAQVPIPGGYSTKTVASFVGFGPLENPRFAMIVVLFEPSASIYAADTSEPLFFEILKGLYPYWGIPVR